jgi:hypothetical protein
VSAWSIDADRFPIVIVHELVDQRSNGFAIFEMRDSWGRRVRSGPVERRPRGDDDPQWDRMVPEPCDTAPDGCRFRAGHMGVCVPTPEQIRSEGRS